VLIKYAAALEGSLKHELNPFKALSPGGGGRRPGASCWEAQKDKEGWNERIPALWPEWGGLEEASGTPIQKKNLKNHLSHFGTTRNSSGHSMWQ